MTLFLPVILGFFPWQNNDGIKFLWFFSLVCLTTCDKITRALYKKYKLGEIERCMKDKVIKDYIFITGEYIRLQHGYILPSCRHAQLCYTDALAIDCSSSSDQGSQMKQHIHSVSLKGKWARILNTQLLLWCNNKT